MYKNNLEFYLEKYKGVEMQKEAIQMDGGIVFDIETTGLDLDGWDEVLQISVIDEEGTVLLNSYVKPYCKTQWDAAAEIHGITPEMVKDAPRIDELLPTLKRILHQAENIITYNGNSFDIPFIEKYGIEIPSDKPRYDVMLHFASDICKEWDYYRLDYKWQKLIKCADFFGYKFKAHDMVYKKYMNGDVILDADDFEDVELFVKNKKTNSLRDLLKEPKEEVIVGKEKMLIL